MRKNFTLLLLLALATCLQAGAATFSGGSGTAEDPYLVSNMQDIEALNELANSKLGKETVGKYFKLTQDIETPVKNAIGPQGVFKGHFDGNRHSVKLEIETEDNTVGLFSTALGATIKNVIIEGFVHANSAVGAIAGSIGGGTVIENVVNYAEVTGNDFIGGIVGQIFSRKKHGSGAKLSNCINYGHISGRTLIGGIVGKSGQDFTNVMERLVNYGFVEGEGKPEGETCMGGIVGDSHAKDKMRGLLNLGTIGNTKVTGVLGSSKASDLEELFYNSQYSPSKNEETAYKKLTTELLGNNMEQTGAESQFNSQYWLFEDGMLPRLKMNGQETSPRAILYATPMLLATGNTVNDVNESFTVKCDNGVKWTAQNGRAEIGTDGKVLLKSIGEEILTATYEGYSRSIKINITAVSGIDNVVIDNARHQDNDAWYTIDGQRVNQPSRGIYIHNRKKIIIK